MKQKFKTKSPNKNFFKRFMAGLLGTFMFTISFGLCGCESMFPMAMGKDDIDNINISGIKVLRRPENYSHYDDDYDGRVDERGYYYAFSVDIFESIYNLYGIVNSSAQYNGIGRKSIFETMLTYDDIRDNTSINRLYDMYISSEDSLKYFYDAIRYQITNVNPNDNGTPDNPNDDYIEVTADTSLGWNWTRDYSNLRYDANNLQVYVYSQVTSKDHEPVEEIPGTSKIRNKYEIDEEEELSFTLENVDNYYKSGYFSSTTYSSTFANENFIYTLGYAIYCIVLGLTPHDAGWIDGKWQVDGFEATDTASSAKVAFQTLKDTFQRSGSYVGLTQRNKDDIVNYILDTIIGERAVNASKNSTLFDLYYEDVVEAVVTYCAKLTKIGTGDGGDSYIDDPFMASELVDFDKTRFFVSDADDPFEQIDSCEYQSIIIMPGEGGFKVSDLWLDFKYVAKDKDKNVIDNPDLYLDIRVVVSWWTGTELYRCVADIRLRNGVYDPGGESTLGFELDLPAEEIDDQGNKSSFGRDVVADIQPFDCPDLDVKDAEGAVTEDGITKLTLTGTSPQRFYYEVVNSMSGFGSYGRLKSSKMGDKPYFEINFDIQKSNIENYRSYDFQVGFSKLEYVPSITENITI